MSDLWVAVLAWLAIILFGFAAFQIGADYDEDM